MSQHIDIDGHRLLARCAPERDVAAKSLLDKLAQMHRDGTALKPGSHVDFGWSMLQIEAHPDHWVVCEPDYGSDPLQWKPQVDDTLRVMQQQAALHDLLSDIPSERTRGDQWLLVQPDAVIAPESYLHRSAVAGQDSGWYIGVENAPEGTTATPGKPMRAGLLIDIKPAWLSVLALPVGYLAHFVGDQLAAVYDAEHKCIYPLDSQTKSHL